ncbi:MAG: ABC transporter ATP-binding protein [Sphaerochaeta sp.]
MAVPLVEAVNLKKYFKTPNGLLHAVEDVSFKLHEGKTLGVVGESGCGKSTLGRLILRLHSATSGKVLFNGENILDYKKREMHKVQENMQMIFQDPYSSLDPRMSVGALISEPLETVSLREKLSRNEMNSRVEKVMELCGLPFDHTNRYPHELDGGLRQRVGLARAMVLEPRFIVCDEPVSALDVSIQAQILNLLMDLQENNGLSYLFITHDLAVVKHISDEIMVMYMGQVIEYSKTDDLFSNPLHPYTRALLNSIPTIDLSRRNRPKVIIKGEVTSPVAPEPGCRFANRCPYATEKCKENPVLCEVQSGHLTTCTAGL